MTDRVRQSLEGLGLAGSGEDRGAERPDLKQTGAILLATLLGTLIAIAVLRLVGVRVSWDFFIVPLLVVAFLWLASRAKSRIDYR